jgi:hypothetical protein
MASSRHLRKLHPPGTDSRHTPPGCVVLSCAYIMVPGVEGHMRRSDFITLLGGAGRSPCGPALPLATSAKLSLIRHCPHRSLQQSNAN